MSCGCGASVELTVKAGERQAAIVAEQGAIDSRRAMCISCPSRKGAAWGCGGRPLGRCSVAGQPIGLMIAGVKPCPRGRHPDQAGRVRWMGISWLGVPMPIRWLAAALGRERGGIDQVEQLPGCGCVERLKAWTVRLAGSVRRL